MCLNQGEKLGGRNTKGLDPNLRGGGGKQFPEIQKKGKTCGKTKDP